MKSLLLALPVCLVTLAAPLQASLAAPLYAVRTQALGQDEPDLAEQPTYDAELERRTSEVAAELRCPVCQGLSIEDSPTDLAREMRAVVREQLEAGRSPEEVKAYYVDKYGEWILLRPRASGFNLLVYVLPWLAVAVGLGVVALLVRRWMRAPRTDMAAAGLDESFDEDPDEAAAGADLNW